VPDEIKMLIFSFAGVQAMLAKFLMSPKGMALDKLVVRYLGFSLLNHAFAGQAGIEPNPALLLETTGRRSGVRRSVVLPYFDVLGSTVVVGSKGGMPTDPFWVENLRAKPQASAIVSRRRRQLTARVAQGEERQRLWQCLTERVPTYAEYQELARAHREIPVLILSFE
jgi:deazaflavin-dependent oxidoreductase (nitroreductase family)